MYSYASLVDYTVYASALDIYITPLFVYVYSTVVILPHNWYGEDNQIRYPLKALVLLHVLVWVTLARSEM